MHRPLSIRDLSGGYCGGVPPLPIPNREVKPACADGTAMQCGRVGGRHFSAEEVPSPVTRRRDFLFFRARRLTSLHFLVPCRYIYSEFFTKMYLLFIVWLSLGKSGCPSLRSRLLAGEVLDIDGITGGFNFQAAWTTAYVAASSIAEAATR